MSAETYYPRSDGCGSMGTKPRKGDHKNGRFRTEIGKQTDKSMEKNRDREARSNPWTYTMWWCLRQQAWKFSCCSFGTLHENTNKIETESGRKLSC